MKIAAVIPAYNEENTIANIVKQASKYVDHIVVVDDCSNDQTAWIAQRAGAEACKHIENKGAGAATRTCLQLAKSFDVVITLDADGQHNPDEIPMLLKPFNLYSNIGIVIGSRFLHHYEAPGYRKFGIDIITWLYNVGHKHKIKDAQSCFRAYSKAFLEKLTIAENGFAFSTEVLLKARKLGFSIVEVPISCIYRNHEQDSTINPVKHGLSVALKTIYWRLKLLT
jgi:glycosyltransferase involved in cell wall biosynthesis